VWGTNNDGQSGVGQVLRHEVEYKVTHPRVAHSGRITVYGATDTELRERAKVAIIERIKYGMWRFYLDDSRFIEIVRIRCTETRRKRF
jgi:hypothetical protein